MKDSEYLWAAKDYIEKHGWCQEAVQRQDRVCAVGALNAVILGNPSVTYANAEDVESKEAALEIRRRIVYALEGRLSRPGLELYQYNDSPRTVKQDILDLFEKTAISMEEQGQ